jgi:hypothetical protein
MKDIALLNRSQPFFPETSRKSQSDQFQTDRESFRQNIYNNKQRYKSPRLPLISAKQLAAKVREAPDTKPEQQTPSQFDSLNSIASNDSLLKLLKQNDSVFLPSLPEDQMKSFEHPQFAINETPILSLMRSVHFVEMMQQGIDISKPQRDPVIISGMPGSSCQMHSQIVNEIMKNMHRKKRIDVSQSNSVNKWRFKPYVDPQLEIKKAPNSYDLTCDLIKLEKQLLE